MDHSDHLYDSRLVLRLWGWGGEGGMALWLGLALIVGFEVFGFRGQERELS